MTFLAPALVASAGSADLTSDQVAAEILRVQGKADDAATRWAAAQAESEDLAEQITVVQGNITESSAQYQQLQDLLSRIAVDRFTGRSGETILILGGNEVESMQRDSLRALALDTGTAGLDNIEAVRSDFETDQAELDELQRENESLLDALATSQADLEQQLEQLASLRDRLQEAEVKAAYEAQLAAQRREAARQAAELAAQLLAEQTAAAQVRGGGSQSLNSAGSNESSAATSSTPAVITDSSWHCPINGPNAFGDTWGAGRPGGRHHQGVDMMSPRGTPIVAVVAGTVRMYTSERGGNLVSLLGADGNRYFYGHLSAWEGGSRSVSAGEVIGYVGATGQTTANHLHFEIHPGGGAAVNPYLTVRQHC
jgi:murein DD-endopeptidase MepM/ murein hydrolase activator NlpD